MADAIVEVKATLDAAWQIGLLPGRRLVALVPEVEALEPLMGARYILGCAGLSDDARNNDDACEGGKGKAMTVNRSLSKGGLLLGAEGRLRGPIEDKATTLA